MQKRAEIMGQGARVAENSHFAISLENSVPVLFETQLFTIVVGQNSSMISTKKCDSVPLLLSSGTEFALSFNILAILPHLPHLKKIFGFFAKEKSQKWCAIPPRKNFSFFSSSGATVPFPANPLIYKDYSVPLLIYSGAEKECNH